MIRISSQYKIDAMGSANPPAAYCEEGDTVLFETMDCADGAVSKEGVRDRTPGKYLRNPATGPLFVRGAEPGDVLAVEILSLKTGDWGFMGSGAVEQLYPDLKVDLPIRIFDVSDGQVTVGKRRFPVDPMIGVIGTAPEGEAVGTMVPDAHGGNMDCTRIREGSTVYLPVRVNGALLAMGDLHASMGDGEVGWYGLEIPGEVTVRVRILKNRPLRFPVVVEGGVLSVVASADTLDEASVLAVEELHAILVSCGWDPSDAAFLLSLQCNLVICQIVDPKMTVRAEIRLDLVKPE